MADFNWTDIKLEYIQTNSSYRKLSEKYGIPFNTISDIGRREGWAKLQKQYQEDIVTESLKVTANNAVDYAANIYALASEMVSQLNDLINEHTIAELVVIGVKPRDVTGALKDLEDILHIKSAADLREQEARISKLQKEAEKGADTAQTITVNIAGGEDSWQK